ncbi:MAG: GNAT family N-acetyltransferase [Candidatus Limnocylindrales bacterium]
MNSLSAVERTTVREVRESDIETFCEHRTDPEASAMGGFEPRDRDAVVARWHEIMADPNITAWTVVVGAAVAGNMVSWLHEKGHREIGYWIGREFWGRGVATEAVRLLLEIETRRPLEGWTAQHNLASGRVLEKNGFVYDRDEDGFRVFRLL